jgi:hypothetical protein
LEALILILNFLCEIVQNYMEATSDTVVLFFTLWFTSYTLASRSCQVLLPLLKQSGLERLGVLFKITGKPSFFTGWLCEE